jgi:signal transduction histidine kinase
VKDSSKVLRRHSDSQSSERAASSWVTMSYSLLPAGRAAVSHALGRDTLSEPDHCDACALELTWRDEDPIVIRDESILRGLPENSDHRLLTVRPLIEAALERTIWGDASGQSPYEEVLRTLHRSVCVQSVSLLLHDGSQEKLVLTAATDVVKTELLAEEYDATDSLIRDVVQGSKPFSLNDASNEKRMPRRWFEWWSDRLRPNPLTHAVFVPIFGDLELQCMLRFFNRLLPDGQLSPVGFSDSDSLVLELLAKLTAVQLNNVWLADRLKTISESISSLLTEMTVEKVGSQAARTGARLANAAAGAVFLPDKLNSSILKLSGSYGFRRASDHLSVPIKRSLMGRVATSGKPLVVEDLQSATDAFPLGPGRSEGMASLIALPLAPLPDSDASANEEQVRYPGVFLVYSKLRRKFHRSTRDLLQQFALSAGSVIDNRRRAEESEELRQVLAFAAHSVRSPLARLSVALSRLRKKGGGIVSNEIQTAFANLNLANTRLGTMLYSRRGLIEVTGLHLSRVHVGAVIESCVARHTPTERSIRIDLRDGIRKLPQVWGDDAKLDLVFDNLIENAIKYSWDNEVIVISGEVVGSSVRISVSDKGLGIPENMRDRIFEPFSRSDVLDRRRHIKGTGLGLYVAKMIVDAHGGEIGVKSSPFLDDPERREAYEGYETTFVVTLRIERVA